MVFDRQNYHMELFNSQLKLRFEIVTGTQTVTSNGSSVSVIDLKKGEHWYDQKEEVKIYPFLPIFSHKNTLGNFFLRSCL
jgi:hypothetical protein